MKKYILFVLLVLCVTTSCKKDNNAPENLFKSYDRQAMLANLGNIILESYQKFYNSTDNLIPIILKFTNEPTIANLAEAQAAWKTASSDWKQCELYNFGPIETLQLRASIDTWPLKAENIESTIANGVTIDNAFIESKSINVKGLKALEYLLFSNSNSNETVIELYTIHSLKEKRKDYLLAVAQNVHQKASIILNSWIPTNGNYIKDFINSDGNDVSSSIGMLVNVIVGHTDEIKNKKLGIPLGKLNGGTIMSAEVESFYSGTSIQNIKDNLETLERVYRGKSITGIEGQGLDDLLNHLGAKYNDRLLSEEILARFKNVNDKINLIPGNLQQALVTNPQSVEDAYTATKDLLVVLKADLVNNLGVLLTFTDNDGD